VLVEAALVFPVIMLLLIGFMQFSSVYFTKHSMLQAAREGARVLAVQDGTTADAEAKANAALTLMLGDKLAGVCTVTSSEIVVDGTKRDGTVTISIPAEEASIVGDPFGFMGGGNINVAAIMRDEE
jgi:Flp pilus assembly protein TadG